MLNMNFLNDAKDNADDDNDKNNNDDANVSNLHFLCAAACMEQKQPNNVYNSNQFNQNDIIPRSINLLKPFSTNDFKSVLSCPKIIASFYNSYDFYGLEKLFLTHSDQNFYITFAEWKISLSGYQAFLSYCKCLAATKPDSLMHLLRKTTLGNMIEAKFKFSFMDNDFLHKCIASSNIYNDVIQGSITLPRPHRLFPICAMKDQGTIQLCNSHPNVDLTIDGIMYMKFMINMDNRKITHLTVDRRIVSIKVVGADNYNSNSSNGASLITPCTTP